MADILTKALPFPALSDVWKASCAVQWLRRDLEPPEWGEDHYLDTTMARRRGVFKLTSWLAGGDLWRLQTGGFDWLSHVGPSKGCLTVRAVWKARLVLNPAGTGVTGVMDPGLGSVRPIGRVKGSESTVRIPRGIEAVRLPDRL